MIKSIVQFNSVWSTHHAAGNVDANGSAEYRKVLSAWIDARCPNIDEYMHTYVSSDVSMPKKGFFARMGEAFLSV